MADVDSNIDIKMKMLEEQIGHTPANKLAATRDAEGSVQSKSQLKLDGYKKQKTKLTKRDSVFFKPTEKDNKRLGELLIKVSMF